MSKRTFGNIQQLDKNKFLLRFSCGADDFGRRKQVSKTVHCKTKKEAERLLMEFYNEYENILEERKRPQNEKVNTLGSLYDEWFKMRVCADLAPRTQGFYSDLWSGHLKKYAKIKLDVIRASHVYEMLAPLPEGRTKNAVFTMLKTMFNYGVKWEHMTKNPCEHLEAPKYKSQEKAILTDADIKYISDVVELEPVRYQVIYYMAVLCAMRRQEVAALKWNDIDFKNNSIFIRRAASYVSGTGMIDKETKTKNSTRKLHMPEIVKEKLMAWRAEQSKHRLKMGCKWINNNYVFTTDIGNVMHIDTITGWWSDFVKKHELTKVTFHGLRHTAASFMIQNNTDVKTVSAVLGHSNTTTTLNIYTHEFENPKIQAINALENRIAGDKKSMKKACNV